MQTPSPIVVCGYVGAEGGCFISNKHFLRANIAHGIADDVGVCVGAMMCDENANMHSY